MPNWFLALDPVSSWLLLLGGACSAGLGAGTIVGPLRAMCNRHLLFIFGQPSARLADAQREYEASEIERAFVMLSALRRRNPDDEESALLMWDVGRDAGHPDVAEAALLHVIRRELERGDEPCAAAHWVALRKSVDVTAAEPSLLLRIAPALERAGQRALCLEALRAALPSAAAAGSGALAARVARCARNLDHALAEEALWAALSDPQLDSAMRNELELERARIYASDASANSQLPALEIEPCPPVTEDPSAANARVLPVPIQKEMSAESTSLENVAKSNPGTAKERARNAERAPALPLAQIIDAEPLRLESDALVVLVGAQRCRVRFDRVYAISAAAVAGLSAKRVLVIDLLLSGRAGDATPHVVRLRSDRFRAAHKLQPGRTSAHALRWLVETLLACGRARALPDREALRGRPYRRYDSLGEYTRAVLGCELDPSFVPVPLRRTIAVGALPRA